MGGGLWVIGYTTFGLLLGAGGLEFGDTKSMVRVLELFFTALFVVAVVVAMYRASRGGARDQRLAPVAIPVDE